MNDSKNIPDEKNSIRIRNMLASIERTFLPVDSTIGKYRVIEEIDRGGMAVVYKATQLDLDRVVALKVMPANISINRGFIERFLTEAHAVAKLNHPNIVKIYEVATEKNIYYLSMEYIPGKNLYYYLHFHKPKLIDVLEIIAHLAEALSYAHSQKIIHRDLKLNNVIMKDQLCPILIDFGLAKAMENDESVRPGITRTGEIMGSPSYMAPERLLGGVVDHRSDICSLGIMLYEMLTFKNPYLDQRNLHQTTLNVMESNPIPPRRLIPWLPVEIEAITLKAMAKDPLSRYQSMDEFRADILRYQHGDPVLAQPPSIITKTRHYVKRHWPSLVISTIVLLFSALFIGTLYLQNKKEQSHWQIVYSTDFKDKSSVKNWNFSKDSVFGSDTGWIFDNGVLTVKSDSIKYTLLNKKFNQDLLIECDIRANTQDLYNAGIFLSGDQPDSGYCFYINKDGIGNHGITMIGNNFLLRDVLAAKVPLSNSNHITIERIQNYITYSINGVIVSKIYDNLPLLGKGHDKVGLFVRNGCAQFDNFKVYRRAIPQVPSPTLIADRFWERGDFEAALDEYSGLLVDFASSDKIKEIRIKMADCLFRLGRCREAKQMIDSCNLSIKGKGALLTPHLYYIEACIYNKQGNVFAADSVLRRLAAYYPSSGTNIAAMNQRVLGCVENIHKGKYEQSLKDINLITNQYNNKNTIQVGELYDELLSSLIRKRSLDSAIALAQEIVAKNSKNDYILINARIKLAEIYLHKGKKDDASELYDLIITGNTYPDRVWEALSAMAEINTYDFNYQDALTLYNKIFKEGPRSSSIAWMAGVSSGMMMLKDSTNAALDIFHSIEKGNHPFPLPRLIAQYYLDKISDDTFKTKWKLLMPDNYWYLFYVAQKAQVKGDTEKAKKNLYILRELLSKKEWNYFRVIKILNNFSRW